MRFVFRPLPGLTVATAIALTILLALGAWQLQRRAEKHQFLAQVATRQAMPPVGWDEAKRMPDPSFVRVRVDAPADCARQALVSRFQIINGETTPGADVIVPVIIGGGEVVLIARGFVPDQVLKALDGEVTKLPCPAILSGVAVATPSRPPGAFTPAPDRARRRWYSYDASAIAEALGVTLSRPMILRLAPEAPVRSPILWPQPLEYATDIPDNHLTYAMTWFGLALTLIGVCAAYHASLGRLGWRR